MNKPNWLIPIILFLAVACKSGPQYAPMLSPEASLKTFRFAGKLKAELYAAEPLVADPVSMEFDEQGNAYVVDMPDAYKPDSTKGRCSILLLKDRDGDGRADTALVFADGLREATTVLPWEGGLLISAAPDILFYKDTTGDGKADYKETLFTGFFHKNEEAQITNLHFGIDNWIYANNNGQAGEIVFNRLPGKPSLQVKGGDFRFRLDRNQFELTSGRGQFGLAMDEWGHRFYTQNSEHLTQVVVARSYIDRNPDLPKGESKAVRNISDHDPLMFQLTPPPYWRAERTRRRNQKSRENNLPEKEFAEDHFTGCSGGTLYLGDALPKEYYGSVFTGDVAGNLVHRDVLMEVDSPFYIARRGANELDKEFMATTDSWVRPASFSYGPDGALYMVDMYRQHIETPLSIPEDLQTGMDFNAGNREGRIYRIRSETAGAYKKPQIDLSKMSVPELLQLLTHTNQWYPMQAHRLLLERRDASMLGPLKELLKNSQDARTRLHALYLLEGMDALGAEQVRRALNDAAPGVREHAAQLAERFPECLPDLLKLTNDTSVKVVYQAALSLGRFKKPEVKKALEKLAVKYNGSPWFRTAVLTAAVGFSVDELNKN